MGRHAGLFAVAGALAIAFSAILVRLADVEPSTAAFFRCLYALPFLALLAWWERRRFGPRELGQRRLAWIAGLFFAVDLIFWHHAIAAVGAQVGAAVLGPETIAFLQAGAIQAVLLYLTLAVGLFGGYAAIRTAAHIAKRKAA